MATPSAAVVTFLFTDIEGSTPLWERYPEAMPGALAEHDAILRAAIESHGGRVFKTVGDAFCAAFAGPGAALSAALAAQRGLSDRPQRCHSGPGPPTSEVLELRVRMGLHTGAAEQRDGDYFGTTLNRAARVMGAGHGGQILLTAETAALLDGDLPDGASLRELGQFRLKGLSQLEHLFQVVATGLPADFPRLNTLDIAPNNLPVVLSSFIGRRAEVAAVQRRVAESRLVTLTGPGGCGKTRLALEAATRLQVDFPDGVWWIELAPLADPALVAQTVAFTLGLREDPNRPLAKVLADSLRPKKALLLLDNCEHLIDACAGLSDTLLAACPRLHILASSREALGITGEVAYRVPSLATADPDHLPPPADLARVEAVRLFAERAAAVRPGFELAAGNAPAVAQIVRRLDGIPLAIELAAARIKALSAAQIAQRLDDRFRLLTGGSRTALPRQQTLRATIDWSYDLLLEPERRMFCRLAVFRGGWTLAAAEAVCAGPDLTGFENLSGLDVLDLLGHLVDKSLVMVEERDSETRYSRLETIRQYGCEKLLESGEGDRVRRRHLDYFLDFAERGDREMYGPHSLEWTLRMERENDNLRVALEYAFGAEGAGDKGVRFILALAGFHGFWQVRSYWKEANFWLEKALEYPGVRPGTALRAKLLFDYNVFVGSSPWEKQRPILEESLVIFDSLPEPDCVDRAYVLMWLGFRLNYFSERERGTRYMQEALRIFETAGDKWGTGFTLNLLSTVICELDGDMETAWALSEQGLEAARECGERALMAVLLENFGWYKVKQGEYSDGQNYLFESLAINKAFGIKGFSCQDLRWLGDAARGLNDYEKAEAYYRESLALVQDIGWLNYVVYVLLCLGLTVLHQGDVQQALSLFNEALEVAYETKKPEFPRITAFYFLDYIAAVLAVQGKAGAAARLYGAFDAQLDALLADGFSRGRLSTLSTSRNTSTISPCVAANSTRPPSNASGRKGGGWRWRRRWSWRGAAPGVLLRKPHPLLVRFTSISFKIC